jgi:hypothetical protein
MLLSYRLGKNLMLSLLKRIAKFAVMLFLTTYTLIWIFSPSVARYYISQYLETHQLVLDSESTVRYNPFLSRLVIEDLAISSVKSADEEGSKNVFTLTSLRLEVSAYRLILDQVHVSEFDISGLHITVDRSLVNEREVLTIAGITIPSAESDTDTNTNQESALADGVNSQEALPVSNRLLQFLMAKMTLKDSSINLIENGQPHKLNLSELEIDKVAASQNEQVLTLNFSGDLDGAPISISSNVVLENGLGVINLETKFEKIDINKFSHFVAPSISGLQGLVSYQGKHEVKVADGLISVEVIDLNIKSINLAANKNAIHASLAAQEFNSELLQLTAKSGSDVTVLGEGALRLQEFYVYNEMKEQVLVSLREMAFDALKIKLEEGQFNLDINTLTSLDARFSDDTNNVLPALAQFTALNVNEIKLTNNGLEINTIELSGLKSDIQIDEKKVLKNLIVSVEEVSAALGNSSGNSSENNLEKVRTPVEVQKETPNKSQKFAIKLNEFKLVDSANVYFLDMSISPNYKRNISLTSFSAGPFNTREPNISSLIKIKGKSDQYDNFDINVDAKPFLDIPVYIIDSSIGEVHLTDLSGYVKEPLGYEIDSGQLDLGIQVKMIGTKIDGEAQVLLRGTKLTSIDAHQKGSLNEATSVPFNLALGMLKDGDGNVELDLPLSGDTSSPSFGLSGFLTLVVKRATIAAAREYLTMTFVPYAGLVKVVMAADDYLLNIEINDLEYGVAEVEVPSDKEEFLSNFAALLTEKPNLQVKLCGVATAEDINKASGIKIEDKDDIQRLLSISEQRAVKFKQYMVEEKQISSSRLLLCKPKLDSSLDAIPHIEFEI